MGSKPIGPIGGILVTLAFLCSASPAELLAPVYVPDSGSFDPVTGEWTGVLLEGGGSLSLTVTGTIDPTVRGSLMATVTVSPPVGVADLEPSWKAAALPLTDLNDDETPPFPMDVCYQVDPATDALVLTEQVDSVSLHWHP